MFVVVYTVALHLLIFWVLARWGHGPTHHISGSELQLLCARHVGPAPLKGFYTAHSALDTSVVYATGVAL